MLPYKIVKKERYKKLIDDLREKRSDNKYSLITIFNFLYHYYGTQASDITVRNITDNINKVYWKGFENGKESVPQDKTEDLLKDEIQKQNETIKKLVKENNELQEYIRNHHEE